MILIDHFVKYRLHNNKIAARKHRANKVNQMAKMTG